MQNYNTWMWMREERIEMNVYTLHKLNSIAISIPFFQIYVSEYFSTHVSP
jgi:hypothetical protein